MEDLRGKINWSECCYEFPLFFFPLDTISGVHLMYRPKKAKNSIAKFKLMTLRLSSDHLFMANGFLVADIDYLLLLFHC
jgi:hypothetical protein